MGQAAVEVILICRINLSAVVGDQFGFHALQGNRLIPVVGDHNQNRQEADFFVIDGKNVGLVRRVVGIEGDDDFFVAVRIVGRIGHGRFRRRHDEILARPGEQGKHRGNYKPVKDAAKHGHAL